MKRLFSALLIAIVLIAGLNVLVGAASLEIPAQEEAVTWTGGNLRMTIPTPANRLNFTGVSIRSKVGPYESIPAEFLSVREGSAIVKIDEAYLETLRKGNYILRYEFLYFHAPVILTVEDPEVVEEETVEAAPAAVETPAAAEAAPEAEATEEATTEEEAA